MQQKVSPSLHNDELKSKVKKEDKMSWKIKTKREVNLEKNWFTS